MSNSDSIKTVLINEIEENLNQTANSANSMFKTKVIDSIISSLSERDELGNKEALVKSLKVGIDPSFRNWQEITSSIQDGTRSVLAPEKSPENAALNEQFKNLLSSIDTLEYEILVRDEEEEENSESLSAEDKIKGLNLPRGHFERFFQSVKSSRPLLHRYLSQHAVFHLPVRQKKKKSRRDKKKEKREKRSDASSETGLKIVEEKISDQERTPFINPSHSVDSLHSMNVEKKIDVTITIFIAKCIAEGSMSSYLVALVYLVYLWNSEEDTEGLMLPLGGIMSALLGTCPKDVKSTEEKAKVSDIRKYILTSKNLSFAESTSEASGGLSKSFDESSNVEDGVSQSDSYFHSAYSETGSTVGSVTVEIGAEVTSLEYELSEDEMLAQALAMSLVVEATPQKDPLFSKASSVESARQNLKEKVFPPRESHVSKFKSVPEELPVKKHTDPMSSLGPLDHVDTYFSEIDLVSSTSHVSIVTVMTVLLMVLSVNCDRLMGEPSICELLVLTNNISLVGMNDDTRSKSVTDVMMQSSHSSFVIIEFILNVFFDKLCGDIKSFIGLPSKKSGLHIISWCLSTMMKVLRGNIYLNRLLGSSNSMFSTGPISDIALGISYNSPNLGSSVSLQDRLTRLLVNIMHVDKIRLDDYSNVMVVSFQLLNGSQPIESDRQLFLEYFHHSIRIQAIQTFVEGFTLFCNVKDRECMIRNLLTISIDYDKLTTISCPKDKEFSNEFYETYLFHRLCVLESNYPGTIPLSGHEDKLYSSESNSDNLEIVMTRSILNTETSKIRFDHFPFNVDDCEKFSESVELLMLKRLKHSFFCERTSDPCFVKFPFVDPQVNKKIDFNWGVLQLVLSLQHRYAQKLIDCYDHKSEVSFKFNSKVSCPCLAFSDDDKTCYHRGPRIWASAVSLKGFAPLSGIHDILLRIDKCDRTIFIGLGSCENILPLHVNHYVGCDQNSWGLMGDGSLWYNGIKVKQDYGTNLTNRSTIKMRYDSNAGTLSYSNGDNGWGIAFSSLPRNRQLFLMVSLREKDDKISILGSNVVSDDPKMKDTKLKSLESNRSKYEKDDITSFLRFSQTVISFADDLISDIESNYKKSISIHPYVGVIIPSLMSAILLMTVKPKYHQFLSLQILPYVMVLTKRLFSLHESLVVSDTPPNFVLYPIIPGNWKFRSGACSNSFPAQEYNLSFVDTMNVFGGSGNKFDETYKPGSQPSIISGFGKGSSKNVKIVGTQVGTTIKFVEDWESGGSCIVEGKLSLCGSFFSGMFTDPKTGKSGNIEGILMSPIVSFVSKWKAETYINNLAKVLSLCTIVCGKLSGVLIVGFKFNDEAPKIQPTISPSEVETGVDPDESNATIVKSESDKWIKSDLFSNGFPIDETTIAAIAQNLEPYFHQNQSSTSPTSPKYLWQSFAEGHDPCHSYSGVVQWWVGKVFAEIFSSVDDNSVAVVDKLNGGDILYEMSTGVGLGSKLDEFVSQHSSPSALMKVGGEPILIARRLIIAALIRHSGTMPLCKAEFDCLQKGSKSFSESRPHPILIEVWKAAQRLVENLIRQRQKTGFSYAVLSKSICSKAELLLRLNVGDASAAVRDSLEMIASDIVLKEAAQSEADSDIQKDCSKLLSEVVEFLLSPIRNVDELKTTVFGNTSKAVTRTAGLRTILLLLNKVDDFPLRKKTLSLTPLSSLSLQPIIMEYLFLSLHAFPDNIPMISSQGVGKSDESLNGHYMNDLNGLNSNLRKTLKDSFESAYEFNTQLLLRCTWLGDKEGQFSALSAWAITISPSEHVFLNRVGIFRVLQTVLDDVRSSSQDLMNRTGGSSVEVTSRDVDFESLQKLDALRGPFALSMTFQSIKKLSQLALRVVHNLASQVAFAKDPSWNLSQTAAPKLVRMVSGPDTLSVSLFEMLYSELFCGIKRLIIQTITATSDVPLDSTESPKNPIIHDVNDDDSLDSEQHIDRILKLLFFVSSSKTCHKSLSSSKWLSLLIASLGCGSLPIQRRVFRLLRRIVSNMLPSSFRAFVPSFFSAREEFTGSESPLDDEDINSYSNSVDNLDSFSVGFIFTENVKLSITSADQLILFLLEAMSVIFPSGHLHDAENLLSPRCHRHMSYYRNNNLSGFISAEALVFLRVLLGIPSWRRLIFSIVEKIIYASSESSKTSEATIDEKLSSPQYLNILASSIALCGGYIDRLRPGGIVSLKPLTLASMSDSFANKLTGTIHNTGMLLGQPKSGESVEVVLMERGMRFVKSIDSDAHSDGDEKTIHFTTSVNGSLPVRGVRLNTADILPSYDVPFLPDTASTRYFDVLAQKVKTEVIPWLNTFLENNKPILSNDYPLFRLGSRNRRIISTESGDRESGDSENEDNYRENEENDDEDIDIGSEMEEVDQEKDDEYTSHLSRRLVEKFEGSHSLSDPDMNLKPVEYLTESNTADVSESLKLYIRMASLRSLSCLVLNDSIAKLFLESHSSVFDDLLKLSIVETQCGGLQVIESAEERWSVFWDSFSTLIGNSKTENSEQPIVPKAEQPPQPSSEDVDILKQLRTDAAERAEASPFAPYLLGRSIDPAAKAEAISQMMDMGLPREWCETSLRRCRYNIEMAINMCFEHGEDMGRLVAEDSAVLSIQSSRERESNWRRRPVEESAPSVAATAASLASLTRALTRSRMFRQENADPVSSVRQLLDMGFPPSWCARAMEQSNQDVNAALAWILSHGEDLTTSLIAPSSERLEYKPSDRSHAEPIDHDSEPSLTFNPLESVSGLANITSDLVCSLVDDGFPSVGCRGFPAFQGKWYFELTLKSSGCIQIGWVDSAYVGAASSGQGVGDDSHSWAFDGWRSYLWHEISTPWSGRWNIGDVVCCSIDIDNLIMGFTLNGVGAEIDMGIAFTNFTFQGGLYPCVSFNKKEKLQFNFGGTDFKYTPPEGHIGFIHHINKVRSENEFLSNLLTNNIFRTLMLENSKSQKKSTDPLFQNSLEETISDKVVNPLKRYFPDESGKSLNSDRGSVKLPVANLPLSSPTDLRKLYDLLLSLSKDLCILNARQIILRLFNSFPKLSDVASKNLFDIISNTDSSFANKFLKFAIPSKDTKLSSSCEESLSRFETLTVLFRLCGIHTARTKIYLHTLSLSPASVTPHHLLGSFTSVGGAPFYEGIRGAMMTLLRYSRSQQWNKSLIDYLLGNVCFDCLNAVRREQSFDYRSEGGLSPVQSLGDGISSHSVMLNTNSLNMATWISSLLVEQFAFEFSSLPSNKEQRDRIISDIGSWLAILSQHWTIALRSPSVLVKTCACQILSGLIQELTSSISTRFFGFPRSSIKNIVGNIPLLRLKKVLIERLHAERLNYPVCSEYLQALMELYASVNQCNVMIDVGSDVPDLVDDYRIELPQLETKHELESPDFNWEAANGRLFSDMDSAIVWTGRINQFAIENLPSADKKITDRTDFPPELLVGCQVTRKTLVPRSSQIKSVIDVKNDPPSDGRESSVSPIPFVDVPGIASESLETLKLPDEDSPVFPTHRFLDRFKATAQAIRDAGLKRSLEEPPTPEPTEIELVEIGTVIEITSWEDDYPGTARVVKWENGNVEKVRWGASSNIYDVSQAKVVNGKVIGEYPKPVSRSSFAINQSFGCQLTFGVIVRLRKLARQSTDDENVKNRFIGILELPDFNASILIDGFEFAGNNWVLTEKKILTGPEDANWCVRFGKNKWCPGTTYKLNLSANVQDPTDEVSHIMVGSFEYNVSIPFFSTLVRGDITIQRSRLFYFDEKFHSASVSPSWDRLSLAKSSGGSTSQGSGFATIGFSTGVHYWEFKVEQAEVGSVFIGVSEKPGPPALVSSTKCSRWMGCGFVSHRGSLRAQSSSSSERVAVYGDYFHTGDIIGVLLDMNKGRLSFFLDGMKYGEHTLADLGEAFDGLASPLNVKPKVLFPVVGLSRNQDRVTITPRWMSSIGCHPEEELRVVNRAWRLMASWSIDRPTSRPSDINVWAYRDAWRDWRRWLSGKYLRIRTRCKPVPVLVDISPLACVQVSIRLGLPFALFHGDRVSFEKSSGRTLETKEEAVILGVYQGQLWFRHDSQQSSTSLSESVALAWSLAQNDVEGMSIVRRSMISYPFALPSEIIDLPLPRIKSFRGGLITLTLSSGAAMRNGLEIDTSDMIREISENTTLHSIESRLNSSNITRHKVIFSGALGWISERMRGGAEEVIIKTPSNLTNEELQMSLNEVVRQANELGVTDRIVWEDVDSLEDAINYWLNKVRSLGHGSMLEDGGILSLNPVAYQPPNSDNLIFNDPLSFDNYLHYATTMDGRRNWTVEADMQLAELLTKSAANEAVTPQNLSCQSLAAAIQSIDSSSSQLLNIAPDRAIARASLLRIANQVIGYALPYFDLSQLEERMRRDVAGSDDEIELSCTHIPPADYRNKSASSFYLVNEVQDVNATNTVAKSWHPPSWARRLRSMRRVLFGQTKRQFWESVLESTTTVTPMHQDEYEDPREIKTISINRIKATPSKLATCLNIHERLKQSVFGQLHKEVKTWSDSSFRRSYVGKGHGGQKRSFKVKFLGEGVNDYGGPYRAVYEQIVDELQCDRSLKSSEKSLLPLLLPSNNRNASVGSIQDKFVLSTCTITSPAILELMHFFGKLLGTAVRQNLNLALDLSAMVWRPLVRLPVSRAHLETVDSLTVKSLDDTTKKGLMLEQEPPGTYPLSYVPSEWEDLNFMAYLPDGSRVPLLPGGEDIPVNLGNWRQYVSLTERCRLRESVVMLKALRDGLSTVLPVEILPLFTPIELEQIISGNSNVDIGLLRQCTEYEEILPDSDLVKIFWEVLEEFTAEERTLFLRFVWARSRMPSSAEDLLTNFKLQLAQGEAKSKPDQYLPHAQTCFFSLSLPPYSGKAILKEKLLYAIHNSPNMDADVRLHNADGWADA